MDNYSFFSEKYEPAYEMVERFHYSGYIPTNIQYCAVVSRGEIDIASVFYSVPATRWSEDVLELCRLVRVETVEPKPSLTGLISFSVKAIRRERKFDLIVSFADSTHGHHGGVYQAASWNYHTFRKPAHDGFLIDGVFVPRRTCNHRWGTSSRTKLVEILEKQGVSCVPHFDKGKHLYWKSLDRNGERKAERLGLKKNPYPKNADVWQDQRQTLPTSAPVVPRSTSLSLDEQFPHHFQVNICESTPNASKH